MAQNDYYYYDQEHCDFVQVQYDPVERIAHTTSVWILCGVVLAGVGISILSASVGTPAEIALKAENKELITHLEDTQDRMENLDSQVNQLAEHDNEMYRSVLGLDPISYDERKAGTGGADVYSDFDSYSKKTADILKSTAQNLESLERSVSIQESSFEEIKSYYNENQEKMKNMPATKPTKGVVLSGFGMRNHPMLGYRRMHEGIDFRADVGDEVYATGDGVVKTARLKGTYGRLVEIDHGHGYTTRYAHLSSFADDIQPGTEIKRGDLIAYSGNSGRSEGPHLHYEILKDGEPQDPINFLFADTSPDEFKMYKEIAENSEKSLD